MTTEQQLLVLCAVLASVAALALFFMVTWRWRFGQLWSRIDPIIEQTRHLHGHHFMMRTQIADLEAQVKALKGELADQRLGPRTVTHLKTGTPWAGTAAEKALAEKGVADRVAPESKGGPDVA